MTKHQKILKTDLLKQPIHFLLFGMLIFGLLSCNFQSGSKTENTRPTVVVSIAPQKFIVEKIAGDLVDVMVMIPPGTSPHVYDPTPRQMVEVGKSSLCFFIGNLGFETAWFTSIKDAYPQLTIVNLNDDMELIAGDGVDHGDHTHAGFNPHTWMSPRNVAIMAERIQEELSEKYPALSHHFKENLSAFRSELSQMDIEIQRLLSDLPNRTFMIFHPSLTYFAKDFGLKEISIEFEGKEPAPIQLKHSIDNARQTGVKVIFIQKEFDADNAKIIAKEIGGRVVEIDPLAESWDKNLMKIVLEMKNSFNEIGETTIH